MRAPALGFFPGSRDVIAAWLVCFAVAAGCLALLGTAVPGDDFRLGALISGDPPATVTSAETDRTQPPRHGSC